jgi:hypothetical protein
MNPNPYCAELWNQSCACRKLQMRTKLHPVQHQKKFLQPHVHCLHLKLRPKAWPGLFDTYVTIYFCYPLTCKGGGKPWVDSDGIHPSNAIWVHCNLPNISLHSHTPVYHACYLQYIRLLSKRRNSDMASWCAKYS